MINKEIGKRESEAAGKSVTTRTMTKGYGVITVKSGHTSAARLYKVFADTTTSSSILFQLDLFHTSRLL